jgi:undecaprenyl-diphosphatase
VGSGLGLFVKVYGQDSRDADLLYRGYRASVLRGPTDGWRSPSVGHSVEHEALLLLMAHRAGVRCPEVAALTSVPDGASMALAVEEIAGGPLDQLTAEQLDDDLLDAVWREVATLHRARIAHRALRAGNILFDGREPVLIDLGFGVESATPRQQAIDRAELLASLALIVGSDRVVASAARSMPPEDLAAAVPYLQPLALSAATRKPVSKALLQELRAGIAATTGVEAAPLERLVRIRPRTLLTITALTAAFYVLLPQLADVGDSVQALRTASWGWLVVSALMSLVTYVAAAVSMAGGVPQPLPFGPNVEAQMASSFVNRVTPANVGGMALNVRFMQKAGVAPAEAVTGVGLNSAVGAVVHILLLFVFLAWAGKGGGSGFKVPASSKLLVIIAVVLALLGIFLATRRGRTLFRTHVVRWFKQSVSSIAMLARSPMKLAALFGGSAAVTLAYIGSLYAAAAAFHADVSVAQVGAVYLGSSIIAAAAPTPGGLGAMEAALVAGFTGVGVEPGIAVAIVLSYRLLTYWLPILPGWISFHLLEHKNMI